MEQKLCPMQLHPFTINQTATTISKQPQNEFPPHSNFNSPVTSFSSLSSLSWNDSSWYKVFADLCSFCVVVVPVFCLAFVATGLSSSGDFSISAAPAPKFSNSFCNEGGPDPEELPLGLHMVSVSHITEFSREAKPYDTGPDDLKEREFKINAQFLLSLSVCPFNPFLPSHGMQSGPIHVHPFGRGTHLGVR